MKTFKSIDSMEHFRNDPLYQTIHELIAEVIAECADYRPEDDGCLVLIDSGDTDRALTDLDVPWRLAEVPFESVTALDGCFHAVYLPSDQFALGFLIPDAEWLPDDLRRHLEAHLRP
jgi:hypothetical protein